MSQIAQNLANLVEEIGADNLRTLPLHHVQAQYQEDDSRAISVKLFLGNMREKRQDKHPYEVWAYLFPASSATRSPEVSFRAYDFDGSSLVFDLYRIGPVGDELSAAYQGVVVTRDKVVALTKYYFLEKMVAMRIPDEQLKHAIPLSSTFVDNLRRCCQERRQALEKPPTSSTRGIARTSNSASHTTTVNAGKTSQPSRHEKHGLTAAIASSLSEPTAQNTDTPAASNPKGTAPSDAPPGLPKEMSPVLSSTTGTSEPTSITDEKPPVYRVRRRSSSATLGTATMTSSPQDDSADYAERIVSFNATQDQNDVVVEKLKGIKKSKTELAEELQRLATEEGELMHEAERIGKEKRKLLEKIPTEDQLDFVYEAGRLAGSKRAKMGM